MTQIVQSPKTSLKGIAIARYTTDARQTKTNSAPCLMVNLRRSRRGLEKPHSSGSFQCFQVLKVQEEEYKYTKMDRLISKYPTYRGGLEGCRLPCLSSTPSKI